MDVPQTWRSAAMSKIPKLSATALLSSTAIVLAAIASTFTAQAAESTPALRQIASIDLPGPPGKRFDYLVIDYDDGWLFSAHLAANQTYVIDLTSNRVLNTVRDTPGAEGLEYVPDERKVYTSNASDNTVGVIDLKTMSVARKIPTEGKPDGSTYATPVHKLYVSDERAKAVAVIDVRTDKILTTLHFDSETGVPLYDPNAKLVYVNLQDRNELASSTRRPIRPWRAIRLKVARAITAWRSTWSTSAPSSPVRAMTGLPCSISMPTRRLFRCPWPRARM